MRNPECLNGLEIEFYIYMRIYFYVSYNVLRTTTYHILYAVK